MVLFIIEIDDFLALVVEPKLIVFLGRLLETSTCFL